LYKLVKKYILVIIIASLIIILDQYTKSLVRTSLAIGEVWSPWDWLTPYARIVNWNNTGAAFGIFQGGGTVLAVLAVFVVLVILYYYPRVPQAEWVLRIALILQLGGAIGNLVDRINFGHVTDFISVGTFPVFNIADASISIGVAVLIVGLWFQESKERKQSIGEGKNNPNETASVNGEESI
jgi:signal peptidase II